MPLIAGFGVLIHTKSRRTIIIDKKTVKGINYYLFANSWMPAQDIEIISGKNPKCRNFGNYTPILSTNDKIYINGYLFNIKTHLRTW